jgi:hypothetical protein
VITQTFSNISPQKWSCRLGILLFLSTGLAISLPSQVPLDQQSIAALEARYDVLQSAYWQTNDLSKLEGINSELVPIRHELDRRFQAQIQANTVVMQDALPEVLAKIKANHAVAYARWCHQTLWRRIKRYHEPEWCW